MKGEERSTYVHTACRFAFDELHLTRRKVRIVGDFASGEWRSICAC